jgi:hypothetical protein
MERTSKSPDHGFVTTSDLHRAMDKAIADGWQPHAMAENCKVNDCQKRLLVAEIERLRAAALDLLRRGAGDLGNEARIRWKQEVKDFLNAKREKP